MKTLSRGPSILQEWFLLDGGESPSARHWWVPVSFAGPQDSEALLGRTTPNAWMPDTGEPLVVEGEEGRDKS